MRDAVLRPPHAHLTPAAVDINKSSDLPEALDAIEESVHQLVQPPNIYLVYLMIIY